MSSESDQFRHFQFKVGEYVRSNPDFWEIKYGIVRKIHPSPFGMVRVEWLDFENFPYPAEVGESPDFLVKASEEEFTLWWVMDS